jgi:hypothetical protein
LKVTGRQFRLCFSIHDLVSKEAELPTHKRVAPLQLKHEGHQLYSDEIVAVGQRQHMGPPLGMNGQNRLHTAGAALAAVNGNLGPMAVPG